MIALFHAKENHQQTIGGFQNLISIRLKGKYPNHSQIIRSCVENILIPEKVPCSQGKGYSHIGFL
jgi:hypothetical protein